MGLRAPLSSFTQVSYFVRETDPPDPPPPSNVGANKLSRPVAGGSVQAGVLKASVLSNTTSTATAP